MPDEVLKDIELNAAIACLPSNYNFEIHKTVWRVRTSGAKMVAQFFIGLNDVPSAIQFLFMSGASGDAFKMAQSQGQMDVYGACHHHISTRLRCSHLTHRELTSWLYIATRATHQYAPS